MHRSFFIILCIGLTACTPNAVEKPASLKLSKAFRTYWYQGNAEISSYNLSQSRYGENRSGEAVLIFVTEDFLSPAQVKANKRSSSTIPILKLNQTKHFLTGIYPYSIMTSCFMPVKKEGHALKVTHSVQEWCGQTYFQLNNRSNFEVLGHSYFEGEADQSFALPKTWLEDEIWTLIRLRPEALPQGNINIIPSFESLRLNHQTPKALQATAHLKKGDILSRYTLNYSNRSLLITFKSTFPFEIESWEERLEKNGQTQLTSATIKKRLKTPYWTQNKNEHFWLRDSLQLYSKL